MQSRAAKHLVYMFSRLAKSLACITRRLSVAHACQGALTHHARPRSRSSTSWQACHTQVSCRPRMPRACSGSAKDTSDKSSSSGSEEELLSSASSPVLCMHACVGPERMRRRSQAGQAAGAQVLLLEWCVWRTKVETTPELLRHQALTLLQVSHAHACMNACMHACMHARGAC